MLEPRNSRKMKARLWAIALMRIVPGKWFTAHDASMLMEQYYNKPFSKYRTHMVIKNCCEYGLLTRLHPYLSRGERSNGPQMYRKVSNAKIP